MTKTLDLGCGPNPKNPFNAQEVYGVDIRDGLGSNIYSADLVIEAIPFKDATFEFITAYHFIEHIPRIIYAPNRRNPFIDFMNEVYRVLKDDGLFLSVTPAYPHAVTFRDPTHVNFITDETFPLYFDNKLRWGSIYGFIGSFEIVKQEWSGPLLSTILKKKNILAPIEPSRKKDNKISICIPVHNGEQHIIETLESISKQNYANFEVIITDDCSNDNSYSKIEEYIKKDSRFKLGKTDYNLGSASKVLNHCLGLIEGNFFVYSSQDDLFSADWLQNMHSRAVESGAQAVIPDLEFYYGLHDTRNRKLIGINGDREIILSNREAFLFSLDWKIPGNALWESSVIKAEGFSGEYINSDEFSVRKFFLNCNKIAFSTGTFHYRQNNPNAVTKRITVRSFEYPLTQYDLYKLVTLNNFPTSVIQEAALRAVKVYRHFRKLLSENKALLSHEDYDAADIRLAEFLALINKDPMFANIIDYV